MVLKLLTYKYLKEQYMSSLNLHSYELQHIHNLDPILTPNWQKILTETLALFDADSRQVIQESILAQKGIRYNDKKTRFEVIAPKTLSEVCKAHPTSNRQLLKVIERMFEFCEGLTPPPNTLEDAPAPIAYDAQLLADEVEAVLTFLNTVTINPDKKEHILRQKIKIAFLYQVASLLDYITINIPKTLRRIDEKVFKVYFKEIFINHAIRDYNFKYLEAVDLDLYQVHHFPSFIKQEVINRKLFLIETQSYWFLICPNETIDSNPFSIRRFLHEETLANYTYLNNVIVPKCYCDNEITQKFLLNLISRVYSLDNNISADLKKFSLLLKQYPRYKFAPIFEQPLAAIGTNTERAIEKITIKFEEALSSSVLQYLPSLCISAQKSEKERDFLFNNLNIFFHELLRLIDIFRLKPLVRDSFVVKNLITKIMGYNILLQKNKLWLCEQELSSHERNQPFKNAMPVLRESYEEKMEVLEKINLLQKEFKHYYDKNTKKSFWQKLGFGKPKYTLEDLKESQQELNNEFFLDIVRLSKNNKKAVVYLEHESNYIPNEDFRHYIISNETRGLSRLPYVIALPEDRELFSLDAIKDDVYWKIFTHIDNV